MLNGEATAIAIDRAGPVQAKQLLVGNWALQLHSHRVRQGKTTREGGKKV
jgi:hypothetical protein